MNLYDIDPKTTGPHFNNLKPRVRQGEKRAAKAGYRPKFVRAPHHIGASK